MTAAPSPDPVPPARHCLICGRVYTPPPEAPHEPECPSCLAEWTTRA
jgi:hypothetical protein